MAITVVLGLLLSLGGWFAIQRRSTAIDDAAQAAQQLIRVQDVRVLVVQADSLAARAYLSGGQEDPAERAAYDESASGASNGLVQAATDATEGDALLLESANAQFARYLGLVEQARANNRQGFPVGAAYLRQARSLTEAIVADLRQVEANSRERVDSSIARAHRSSWLLVLTTVLVLAAIVAGGVWLALRWKRLINVPLAAAGMVALLVLTGGVGLNAAAMSDADEVVDTSLAPADVLAQARAAAFDARSNEALMLINRGNGAANRTSWEESMSIARGALSASCDDYGAGCAAGEPLAAYATGFTSVRSLDEDGNWEEAVLLSTTGDTTAPDVAASIDPVGSFEEFATLTGDVIGDRTAAAVEGFEDASAHLGALSLLVVAAGLAIAVLSALGYAQRLREYR